MNENVSAGGGHQGSILAPPAVPDLKQTSLTSSSPVCNNSNICNYTSTAGTTSSLAIQTSQSKTLVASSNYQEAFTHQQRTLKNQYCAQENSQSSALMPQKSTNFTTVVTAVSNTHRNEISNCGDQSSGPPNTSNKKLDSDFSPPLTKKLKIANLEVNKNIAVTSLITNRNILPENKIKTTLTAGGLPTLKVKILKGKYQIKEDSSQKISEYAEEVLYLKTIGSMSEFGKSSPMQLVSISSVCNTDQVAYEKRDSPSNLKHHHQNVNVDREILTTGQPLNVFLSKNKTSQVSITKNESKGSLEPEIISSTAQTTSLSNSGIIIPASNEKNNTLPQGAEIKIPAIGATPVAVSTKLPAAVVQLTQQGGTPLVPCSTATGSTTLRLNDKNIHEPSSYITYNNAGNYLKVQPSQTVANVAQLPALVNNSDKSNVSCSMNSLTSGNSNAQEFSFKAKQEVYVMQRISELQREGLWAEKRLPKLQEPSRPKAHWDYLLEEMVWLAADFAQERKWKKNAAKKCSKMIQKYFLDKKNALNKAEKTQEAHLRRVAAFISKEIKMFWSNVEKLVEYKHHTKLEEKRKKALDQHLSFIVDQTEKFSQQLAEGMNKSVANTSTVPSLNSSKISSPRRDEINASDDEFKPDTASEDDEETIAKAEEDAADVNEEVAALEKESQMDLDDFIKDLPKGYLENRDKIVLDNLSENSEKDDSDAEFKAEEPSEDDEVTISKQEEEETDIDYKKEITELEADNDLTVEQLVAKYKSKALSRPTSGFCKQTNEDSEVDDEDEMLDSDDSCNSDDNSDEISSGDSTHSDSGEDEREEEGLQSLIDDVGPNNKDDIIKDATALAESIQPKGNTLSSTNVVTPVPFLLKHPLREYQHIGLDWLVTMNDRKLNGILADEMGLGKTIQTIALLAHLACVKGNWGPHLIVVPSSVILNWDMEFKKWCPGFKILTYYGTQKERKLKRVGWTKPNAFHVCITSYKLVIQDQQSFRRKKWKYLILDEAQNIKNFKSQRWQLLLNFSTERRLLLTGTPLQNDLMELWSLMHFLMPSVFSSHREFKEWFSNPMTGMIEGSMEYNESLINRLHKVIRPFLLRRLKKEVEKQMPKKYEHVIMCRLSNRQRYLYDDFMSHAKTKETLQTGNLLSVINVLMQLRKVCNHPNMFEVRPTISPFQMDGICFYTPRLVCDLFEYNPFKEIDLHTLNLLLVELEVTLTAYVSYRSRQLAAPKNVLEEVDSLPDPQPKCPIGKYKFRVRVHDHRIQENFSSANAVHVGASPKMKFEGNKIVPAYKLDPKNSKLSRRLNFINPIQESNHEAAIKTSNNLTKASSPFLITNAKTTNNTLKSSQERISNSINSGIETSADDAYSIGKDRSPLNKILKANNPPNLALKTDREKGESSFLEAFVQEVKTAEHSKKMSEINPKKRKILNEFCPEMDSVYKTSSVFQKRIQTRLSYLKTMSAINAKRVEAVPIYGSDCRESYEQIMTNTQRLEYSSWQSRSYLNCSTAVKSRDNWKLSHAIKSYEKRCGELQNIFKNFVFYVPSACAPRIKFFTQSLVCKRLQYEKDVENITRKEIAPKMLMLHPIISAMTTQFPDPRLIQYDCGKLQTLDKLLRQLKTDQHRVLIFTQMTKMLDILEAFLNYHGYIYLRLDGSTKVEQRQIHMERFNGDKRIFCFILSTRSGGVGINLTGADTVIFYDSDWNPTMDAQAQDRCHRIGQTRDVHIYRLVSEKTIEVNILRKANQKRMLSDMAIEGGNFTTSYFKSSTIKDLFNTEQQECELSTTNNKQEKVTTSYQSTEAIPEVEVEKQSLRVFENALAAAEDEQDVQATKVAKAEAAADLDEFDETIPITEDFNTNNIEMSKADKEVENLVKQLSPIERYAMRFVEETGAAWTAEQLRAAEEEIEAQKREWEANRLYALKEEEEMLKEESKPKEIITYHRKDANNQVNRNKAKCRTNVLMRSKKRLKRQLNNTSKDSVSASPIRSKHTKRILYRASNISNNKKSPIDKKSLRNNEIRVSDSSRRINLRINKVEVIEKKGSNATVNDEELSRDFIKTRRSSLIVAESKRIKRFSSESKARLSNRVKIPTEVLQETATARDTRSKDLRVLIAKGNGRRNTLGRRSEADQVRFTSNKIGKSNQLRNSSNKQNEDLNEYNYSSSGSEEISAETTKDRNNSRLKGKKLCNRLSLHKSEFSGRRNNFVEDDVNVSNMCSKDSMCQSETGKADCDDRLHSGRRDSYNEDISDITAEKSSHYKLSEESETDDNEVLAHLGTSVRKKAVSNTTLQTMSQDKNSRHTRSHGAVKINLWTLDVSPVLPDSRSHIQRNSLKREHNKSPIDDKEKRDESDQNSIEEVSETSETNITSTPLSKNRKKTDLLKSTIRRNRFNQLRKTNRTSKNRTLHHWLINSKKTYSNEGSNPQLTVTTSSQKLLQSANGPT